MKPILYVGNRNYSSWSLRPWLVLAWSGLDFETRTLPLGGAGYSHRQMPSVLAISPSGTVPALHIGDDVISDSLAISEWAAEQVPSLWPSAPIARAHARSAACEMHSGFVALRTHLTCNIRRRTAPRALNEEVARDVARIETLWNTLRRRYGAGGPFLFGATPTIADAFYTPVATRFRTYGVKLGEEAAQYSETLLTTPAFLEWEKEAIAESWTIPESDEK
ncbi:Glutathione S-transferase [Labilithrix luteola]|uniref:Glutathione S-transferase n=1 Tax=Labilithrix luteola TaxID=1391654 RepID=A0A0K1Q797_9BACT|nr:glutathione S-transferase [Labilithrix luteola]AKV01599.1 Glutathione S-transferase [Labilithrix luteola]